MKRIFILTVISILIITTVNGLAQTTVTGHVFAEVVETVSASSQSKSSFTFQKNQSGSIDFGQIEVKSSASASCSLILGKANLTGNDKQCVSMETSAFSLQNLQNNAINGNQFICLQCLPTAEMLNQNALSYQGEINIVLAYN